MTKVSMRFKFGGLVEHSPQHGIDNTLLKNFECNCENLRGEKEGRVETWKKNNIQRRIQIYSYGYANTLKKFNIHYNYNSLDVWMPTRRYHLQGAQVVIEQTGEYTNKTEHDSAFWLPCHIRWGASFPQLFNVDLESALVAKNLCIICANWASRFRNWCPYLFRLLFSKECWKR